MQVIVHSRSQDTFQVLQYFCIHLFQYIFLTKEKWKTNLWLKFSISDACFNGVFVFLDPCNADINSRFVSKGPIHKLLNNIAMSFDSACDIEKRSRSQIYPLFLLNLNCPRSLYDSTLEPSKTSVEFKDWHPVLLFIEDTVTNF